LLAGIAVMPPRASAPRGGNAIPNVTLPPGATIPIGLDDVCSVPPSNNDPAVPDDLKRQVLKEYRLNDRSATAYEIDYLVTPQLGRRHQYSQSLAATVFPHCLECACKGRAGRPPA
jgi:hypothetical protein